MPDSIPDGFRGIPGYPRYAIDENGTVISACVRGHGAKTDRPWKDSKHLKPATSKTGYHFVCLRHDGHTLKMNVHKLVLLTFVGPCPDGMQCRHLDGNPANNHVSNLSWGTPHENHRDRIRHGTSGIGEKNSSAKLNADDVLEIRRRAANGETQNAIANDFPVNSKSINDIVNRHTWKHVQ